jgi:hypothetical protein
MHPVLAGFLMAWRERTPYAKDDDYVFPSFRLKSKKPLSLQSWCKSICALLPLRPESLKKASEFASASTTSGILWLLR